MPYWTTFIANLKLVVRMVRQPHTRERIKETCFKDPPAYHRRDVLDIVTSTVHEKRLGTIANACYELGQVKEELRQFWDLKAYCKGKVPTTKQMSKHGKHDAWRLD
eukprot:8971922-Pyramimonas_sp.AAC.1